LKTDVADLDAVRHRLASHSSLGGTGEGSAGYAGEMAGGKVTLDQVACGKHVQYYFTPYTHSRTTSLPELISWQKLQ
jgi:hypothetical protein